MIFRRKNNTKDEVVFALPQISELNNKILISKAQREDDIKNFLTNCSQEQEKEFAIAFDKAFGLLHKYLVESNRLIILLDTNAIQDILSSSNDQKREARYFASKAILCFMEDYANTLLWMGVTPTVFYELNGLAPIKSKREYEQIYGKQLKVAIDLGVRVHEMGFRNFSELKVVNKKIYHDAKKIGSAISKINQKDWKTNFENKYGGITIPFAIAEEETPNIKLKYFSAFQVKFLLMHQIEKKMYAENKDSQAARNLMNHNLMSSLGRLNKLKKGKLTGLADIELLTHAELSSQSRYKLPTVTAALTYDDNLLESLHERSAMISEGARYVAKPGSDPSGFASSFVYEMKMGDKRNKECNRKHEEIISQLNDFCENVFPKKEQKQNSEKSS